MKIFLLLTLLFFNLSAHAEFILSSSKIEFNTAKFEQTLDNGNQLKIFPATIRLVEIDSKSGAVRQTTISLDLNQIKTPLVDMMIGDDPQAAPGPWLLLGIGYGVASMDIHGLSGHSLSELLDQPFSGQLTAYGFGYVKRNLIATNKFGIKLIDPSSKGIGYQKSNLQLVLSSTNVSIVVSFSNTTDIYNLSLNDFRYYKFR